MCLRDNSPAPHRHCRSGPVELVDWDGDGVLFQSKGVRSGSFCTVQVTAACAPLDLKNTSWSAPRLLRGSFATEAAPAARERVHHVGVLVNAGFALHVVQADRLLALEPLVRYAVVFFVMFSFVTALLKYVPGIYVPDIDGDLAYGIRTFKVRIGPKAVFDASIPML